ncbi:winged helix-turn-helix transcriptional regulator [Pseudorhizobium pelagicum]|uniref:HxlR family transcriptional regulator n=1 Tax=Pseudorhizobium pelagicum TaxID=1509405 RepID=A0A922NZE9_9HYPH|nr:helix-turn-helix domain-containing protein [Pseudorhizobium pelagicum]KEQ06249.1 HxlR family transcriptional regulator [Pseudorhizobium pelagicum]KEQ09517.1 HxlR family transcriptional regulator [Pseudorhizobium pelagicum]
MFAEDDVSEEILEPCGMPDHEDCGLRLILDRLGEKWTVMTVAELAGGPRRYREIERSLTGVTQRMLTLTLRRLERDGFLSRTVEPTNPPSVTYALTASGQSFARMVTHLVDWSRSHKDTIRLAQQDFDRHHVG